MLVISDLEDVKKDERMVKILGNKKKINMSLNKYNELSVGISYYDDEKKPWIQESFDITKDDGEIYQIVNGAFASYSGDVYFDTHGANLVLLNEDGNYRFFFMGDYNSGDKEIRCNFFNDSIEKDSMIHMFNRFYEERTIFSKDKKDEQKPKMLSKTLQNTVEK